MSIKFTEAATHTKGYMHQMDAWEYLQQNTPPQILAEFAKKFRNEYKAPTPNIVSQDGVRLIKEFEGCHLFAYYDPLTGGLPITIGWGSTKDMNGRPFKITDKVTQQQADELFNYQLRNQFIPPLTKIPDWNEMTDEMRGALLSFAYNLGANFYGSEGFATITKVLKEKSWHLVPEALYRYRNPGSSVEKGLARRRRAEGALWERGLSKLK
jgi:lysozyme